MKSADVSKAFWQKLYNSKFDVKEGLKLGLRGIFIRDYKNYELQSGLMGVAVSTGSIDTLVQHFSETTFAGACEEFTQERKLGLFLMVAMESDDQGQLKLQLFVHQSKQSDSQLTGKYQSLLAMFESVEEIQLKNKREFLFESTGNHATVYDVGNLTYTRKKIESLVKQNNY